MSNYNLLNYSFKVGVIKELFKQGLITKTQMEQAICKIKTGCEGYD